MKKMEVHKKEPTPVYTNKVEKVEYFDIVHIASMKELNDKLESIRKEEYFYRGVNNSLYKIFSSYHRYLFETEYPLVDERSLGDSKILNSQFEEQIFNETFRSTLEELKSKQENEDDYLVVGNLYQKYLFLAMSKLQHYAKRSFLIDFTIDPLVALFFAVYKHQDAEQVSVMYFPKSDINYISFDHKHNSEIELLVESNKVFEDLNNERILKAQFFKVARHFLYSPIVLSIEFGEISIGNFRQEKQMGCFICYNPHLFNSPLENRIVSGFENPANRVSKTKITSVDIDKKLIPEIKYLLFEKGYTEKSLGLK